MVVVCWLLIVGVVVNLSFSCAASTSNTVIVSLDSVIVAERVKQAGGATLTVCAAKF